MHVQPEWLTRRPMQLSGGSWRVLRYWRALGPRTRFLIADEMTAQLDPSIQKAIWGYVLEVVPQPFIRRCW
ncbi:peptide ABC transporter ATP-binding protein [Salmonella enterica subsp. enterica]|uniref:Peptide ABC transporter ATP-binding protein n=1 Tax=Salmonella enterica I TaxID=59201 RepID=A0A3S4HC30_SALET|nr:peptide ABC transporter ATP-binding protein [Salmonella enterica subsp. enterica]